MDVIEGIAHLIVPRHTNNHKAKLLHSSSLVIIVVFFIIYQVVLNLYLPKTTADILGYAANISIGDVVNITNQKRQDNGLAPLSINPTLSEAARRKGEDMLAKDYWAHVAPDGTQPWKFFADVGYKYRFAGENLARDFTNANSAIDAWMASPTHKENMLSGKYKEIGVAVVEGDMNGVDTTIIVQLFGATTEAVAQVTPATVANSTPTPNAPAVILTASPTPPAQLAKVTEVTPALTVTSSPIPAVYYATVNPIASYQTASDSQRVLISPFTTTKSVSYIMISVLMTVLVIDVVVISRKRISRVSGRTAAHLAFLGIILAIVVILNAGRIL